MPGRLVRLGLAVAVVVAIGGCSSPAPTPLLTPAPHQNPPATVAETHVPGFVLSSPDFAEGEAMPAKFTCDGGDTSPALHWIGAPASTLSFALIVEDPDASSFVHWVAYDIPGGTFGDLAEGIKDGSFSPEPGPNQRSPIQGVNSFGANGYRGPCPPSGTHHYVFTLYALAMRFTTGVTIGNRTNATADDLRNAMKGWILARTTLTGTYTKPT